MVLLGALLAAACWAQALPAATAKPVLPSATAKEACPSLSPKLASIAENLRSTPKSVDVHFKCAPGVSLATVYWLTLSGAEEQPQTSCKVSMKTHAGHAFRVYSGNKEDTRRVLLLEYVVTDETSQRVTIPARPGCPAIERTDAQRRGWSAGDLPGAESLDRNDEFVALRHAGGEAGGEFAPCEPQGQSELWSCVRRVSAAVCEDRHRNRHTPDGSQFAFQTPGDGWPQGSFEDHKFDWQMPRIPQLTDGPGFLKMNMTTVLKEELLPWYAEAKARPHGMRQEKTVPGGYMNNQNDIVQLDWTVLNLVKKEMEEVLEWWTNGMDLVDSAIYGTRVYRRGAVLLNHVDRWDTHLVSAILQIHQEVDKDGGWPVEVLDEDRNCFEVYLQPGEMLLYEGARFKHGRPMVFRGDEFANTFVHFKPQSYDGQKHMEM